MNDILNYVLRIALALFLGAAIGLEREVRIKEAGIRTHGIVCLGACMFMLISQYAFPEGTFDSSRVAAQVVAGMGFLGVGIIVYRKGVMQGLTTAAGVWATAAVGMCCGASGTDFLVVAVVVSAMIIIFQCIFHLSIKFFKHKVEKTLHIRYAVEKGKPDYSFFKGKMKVERGSVEKQDGGIICSEWISVTGSEISVSSLVEFISAQPCVLFAELTDPL